MGSTPGVKTPNTPDEGDEVDAGDVLQGLGTDGLRRVRRVRRVGWWKALGTVISNCLNPFGNLQFATHTKN